MSEGAIDSAAASPDSLDLSSGAGGMRRGSFAGVFGAAIMASLLAGCISDAGPTYTYLKNGQEVSADQEAVDKAACQNEGDAAANAARPPAQNGGYDLVKNMASGIRQDNADDIARNCMSRRGYVVIEGRKGLFN